MARNYLWLSGAEVVSKVATFAAFAYVARVAGPTGYGYVEFAVAVFLFAGLVVEWGLGAYGAREVAKEPSRTETLVREIVTARLLLAVVAYGGVLAVTLVLDPAPVLTRLLVIYGASLLAMPWLLQWVFQGHDDMRAVAIATVTRQAGFAVVVFLWLRSPEQLFRLLDESSALLLLFADVQKPDLR